MSTVNKLSAFFLALVVSHSASAVIIEGSFEGNMWNFWGTNMELTPEAKFWSNENAFAGFRGTFWYDTEVATQTSFGVVDGELTASYSGPHNWLHTTLIGHNGGTLDLTSSGSLGTFSTNPTEGINLVHEDDRDIFQVYYDDTNQSNRLDHRVGTFSFGYDTYLPFLNDFSLIQNASVDGNNFDVIGYMYFDNSGSINGVEYSALVEGEINKFEMHVRQPVTVPEPSSIFLLLAPLMLLMWRTGLLPRNSVKSKTWKA